MGCAEHATFFIRLFTKEFASVIAESDKSRNDIAGMIVLVFMRTRNTELCQ